MRSKVNTMILNKLMAVRVAMLMPLAILVAGCSVFGVRNYDTPKYQVILQENGREIRYYEPYIVAKTTLKGEFKQAQREAFRILADYIFGANQKKQEIAMTGPVVQEPEAEGQEIKMTAPVVQSPDEEGWTMAFMMPPEYKLEELPIPNDKRVVLEKVPAKYMAAIRYTWFGSEARNQENAKELMDWLVGRKDFSPVSKPMYAGYDPPWTLPFVRRNEMLIEVKKTDSLTK
jgi:hypothetical protein